MTDLRDRTIEQQDPSGLLQDSAHVRVRGNPLRWGPSAARVSSPRRWGGAGLALAPRRLPSEPSRARR